MGMKKAPADKLGKSMGIRLRPTERKGFARAAHLAGLDLSQWMRERLRRAARAELESAKQPVPFMV